jgi:hypothetical protein
MRRLSFNILKRSFTMRLSAKMSIATSLILCALQPAYAAECSAKSGAATVPLLELYTSEGCSSCPPADKWMSGIKTDKVTPLAFHVDYWDYIGWKDKFSKAEYSDRQRKGAAFAGAGYVYTPQFVMNGRDFKGWDNSRLNEKIESSQRLASRANLSLDTMTQANGDITLKASAQATKPSDAKNTDVFIAIYENKLSSKINAGENSGRELKHDYVVREFFGAYQISNQNEFSKNFTLNSAWKNKDGGAVIFVQNSQTGEILQSLALPFCKG